MRLFAPFTSSGKRLLNVGTSYDVGKAIPVADAVIMTWDHRDKLTFKLATSSPQYLLVEEICDEAWKLAYKWTELYEESFGSDADKEKAKRKMEAVYDKLRPIIRRHMRPELRVVGGSETPQSSEEKSNSVPLF